MANAPTIVAVTVTFNPGEDLTPFLESFRSQICPNLHLVIVDNDSRDGTAAALDAISDVNIRIIRNARNVGVAAANNQGVAAAREMGAGSVLFLNNDTVFGPELIEGLALGLDYPRVAAISPMIPFHDEPDRIWYGGGSFQFWRGVLCVHDAAGKPVDIVGNRPFRTSYAPTCCLLVDSRVFDRIGMMDESYFVYWDDTDFVWRMRQADLGLMLDPRLKLLHKVSRSTGGPESPFSIRYAQRNQMLFVRKNFSTIWVAYTAAVSAAVAIAKLALGRLNLKQTRIRLAALYEGLNIPLGDLNEAGGRSE